MKSHHLTCAQRENIAAAFRRTAAALFVGLLAITLLGDTRVVARPSGQSPRDYQIAIKDFSFQPKLITVPVGAKVVWTNQDEEPHTVVSVDHAFFSKALDTGDQFSFTFNKPGTYEYFCSVHPRMVAKIMVADSTMKHPMKMDKMN